MLIQTTETTMTDQPTMESDEGGRGMPKDAQDPSASKQISLPSSTGVLFNYLFNYWTLN